MKYTVRKQPEYLAASAVGQTQGQLLTGPSGALAG